MRDISSTGLYLETAERWVPGEIISLTLQRSGPLEGDLERRVAVQAQAIRQDDHGVAVSFVLPHNMELRLWESPLKSTSEQNDPEDVLREFRIAGALAFLNTICPDSVQDFRALLREGLSNYRAASATEITLRAERILAFGSNAQQMRCPANVALRILEQGSWADTEAAQQLWAGLLATSCTFSGRDDSNLIYVDLFAQLTPIHVRLLTAACTKSAKFVTGQERLSSRPVTLSAQDLSRISGTRDLIRVHRDLEFLSDLGLITMTVRSVSFSPIYGTDVAPTGLGLELFARCNGYRGTAQEFFGISLASSTAINAQAEIVPDGASATGS